MLERWVEQSPNGALKKALILSGHCEQSEEDERNTNKLVCKIGASFGSEMFFSPPNTSRKRDDRRCFPDNEKADSDEYGAY